MYRVVLNVLIVLAIIAVVSGGAVYLNRQFASTIVATLVAENDSEIVDLLRNGEKAFAIAHRVSSITFVLAGIPLVLAAIRGRRTLGRPDWMLIASLVVALALSVATSLATRWSVPLAPKQVSLIAHSFALPAIAALLLIALLSMEKGRRTGRAIARDGVKAGGIRAGFIFVSGVSGMIALASLEVLYILTISAVTFADRGEALIFVLVALGMAALVGLAGSALTLVIIAVLRYVLRRLSGRRDAQAFALAIISGSLIDGILFLLLYGFEDLRFIQLYVAIDFLIALGTILAFYPLIASLRLILDREAGRGPMEGPDLLAVLAEAWAVVFFYPAARVWRFLGRKPQVPQTGKGRAILLLSILSAGLFALDLFAFHTYGSYIHVVLSVALINCFQLFWLLVLRSLEERIARPPGARVRRIEIGAFAAGSVLLAAAPFLSIERSANVKYIACNRTDLLKTEILIAQSVLDLDRDGFSAALGGGDPDDRDAAVNPERGDFREFAGEGDDESLRPLGGEKLEVPSCDRMNVIVFCVDALRVDGLGCYGAARSIAPAIDGFARESILYEHAYTPGPATPIAQYSILTGRYARRLIWQTVAPDNCLSLFFRDGFASIAAQGLLLDDRNFRLVPGSGEFGLTVLPVTDHRNTSREQYERLVEFLASCDRSKRIFLWVQFLDPHFGFVHHDEVESFGSTPRGRYMNEVLYTDRYVGKSIEYLKASGLWEDSLVVITADHGTELFDHGKFYHGQELYEESVRVPLIIHIPSRFTAAEPARQPRRIRTTVSTLPLLSTIHAWTTGGFEVRESGVGPLPLHDAGPGEAYLVSAYEDKFAIVAGRTKMIYNRAFDTYQVYDLDSDPRERRNICSAEHDGLRRQLLGFIRRHRDTYPRECPLDFR